MARTKDNESKVVVAEKLAAMVRDAAAAPATVEQSIPPALPELKPGQRYEASFPKASAQELALGHMATKPSNNAAVVIARFAEKDFGEQSLRAIADSLNDSAAKIIGGNMAGVESMLVSQAYALQAVFMNMTRRASNAEYIENMERCMRIAMKAQNQCRMTLETLATIKNPPVVYAKQANITSGPQQVNNGIPSHACTGGSTIGSNELLGDEHG